MWCLVAITLALALALAPRAPSPSPLILGDLVGPTFYLIEKARDHALDAAEAKAKQVRETQVASEREAAADEAAASLDANGRNSAAGSSTTGNGSSNGINNNSVSKLHELVTKFKWPSPVFSDKRSAGPPNDPTFSVECTVTVLSRGMVFKGRGSARGKKSLAKQMAAAEALKQIVVSRSRGEGESKGAVEEESEGAAEGESQGVDEHEGEGVRKSIKLPPRITKSTNAIGWLNEMSARHEFLSGPHFTDIEREGGDHTPIHGVTATVELPPPAGAVGGGTRVVSRTGRAPSKKAAKRIAAEDLCKALGLE